MPVERVECSIGASDGAQKVYGREPKNMRREIDNCLWIRLTGVRNVLHFGKLAKEQF